MKTALSYGATFVTGFAACALILYLAQGRPNVGREATLPPGRQALSQALAKSPPSSGGHAFSGLPSVADAAACVAPAVVSIEVEGHESVPGRGFFGQFRTEERRFEGSGSGIILSAEGYVLTNYHVISPLISQPTAKCQVTLADGRRFSVTVIGGDQASDLAVIKLLGAKTLTPALLGDSDTLRVGDWAIAVGSPLGFNSTVTLGIISALNRQYPHQDSTAVERVIQTDASINPGNSGGALADGEGRVIGINTAIATTTGAAAGIGFAIPINTARKIAAQLIENGKMLRPYLGVVYTPLSEVERSALPGNLVLPPDNKGVLVHANNGAAVVQGSPAQKSGIVEWDILRTADGKLLEDSEGLRKIIASHAVGEVLKLTLWRDGTEQDLVIPLEEMPEGFSQPNR
ncbi:trypsin-like peptidase domain-containing protein [Armatimonas sp.]|uniref:S1C family serine protease n=1 Tax=Armatimonas sp. TaxID=1872638 RepID=UPI00286B544A|nr:trypsin-like peptidase domain-containing protein [Armatimonas sp.]